MGQFIGTLIIIGLFVSGAIFTMFFPILLPEPVINAIKDLVAPIFAFEGLAPVAALFTGAFWTINILLSFMVFKIVMGLVSMINGNGQPEVE